MSHGIYFRFYLPYALRVRGWLWRQQIWGQSETRGNMSAHSAISRTAASRVHPTWVLFGRAKSRSVIAACFMLLEN